MFFLWLKKSAIISLINQMCPAGCSWEHLHDLTDKVWVERRLCKLWGCSIKQPLCFYWKHPHTQIHNPGAEHINNPTQTHMHMLPHLHTQLCILIPQVVSIPSQCAGGFMKLLRVQVLLWVCFHEFIGTLFQQRLLKTWSLCSGTAAHAETFPWNSHVWNRDQTFDLHELMFSWGMSKMSTFS